MQLRLTLAAATDSTKSQEVFMNIAILTDTNSGIFPAEGQAHGIHVLPMPVILDGKTYYEGVNLTAEALLQALRTGWPGLHLPARSRRCPVPLGGPAGRL